jgi:hypothetical protein
MRLLKTLAFAFLAIVTLSQGALAQELRGRIAGVVTDDSGAVVPGVTVTATSPALIQPQTTTSGADGSYRFPALPSGLYTLTYQLQGFQTVKREGLRVTLNQTFTIDAKLKPASLTEALTITADTPTVDTKTTSIGTAFTKELLTDIPNARDVWAAMSQAPGFQMQGYDVGGSHTGTQTGYLTYGVGDQNKTLFEGINVTESTAANAGYFDFGSFEEFQLGGAGNLGEQSGPGALMNISVKSGGDKFGGQIYFDYEDKNTIGDNIADEYKVPGGRLNGFFAPTIVDPATGQRLGLLSGNPISKQYDLNVNVGGPIIKSKLWFFVGYRDNNQYRTILGLPGTEAQSQLLNYTGKLTYQLNPKNQIIAFYNERTKLQPLRDLSLTTPVEAAYWQGSKNRPVKLEWTSVLSDRAFLDLQFSHWRNAFPLYPTKTESSDTEGVGPARIDSATGQRSGGNEAYQDQLRNKPQLTGSLAYFADKIGPGNHSFKLGFEWQRDRKGFLSFQPGNLFYRDRSGALEAVDIWNTPNDSINDATTSAVYLNDTWAINSRLSFNLGLRYDRYVLGWPEQSLDPEIRSMFANTTDTALASFLAARTVEAADIITFNSLSPRIGFAWDITGKGRTVLKAFAGQYFYNPSADVTDRENPVGRAQRRYRFLSCTAGQTSGCDLNNNRVLDAANELGTFLTSTGGAGSVKVDRGIDHPYGLEFSTHLEHEIIPAVSGRASYVFKGTRNEWAEIDTTQVGAYTNSFSYVDAGPDGVRGNGDDQTVVLNDLRAAPATVGSNRIYGNPADFGLPSYNGDYHTVEFAVNRRLKDKWMLLTSFEHTWAKSFVSPAQASTAALGVVRQATAFLWQPNQRRFGRETTTFWNFKLLGRYELPWDLAVAASFKLQSGFQYGRYASVPLTNAGAQNIAMESVTANRSPNVGILDLRAEKSFKIGGARRITGMVDVFNATNNDVVTNFRTISAVTAATNRYRELISLLDPRIVRFGVRLDF